MVVRYKMIGRDINSLFPQYRTWVIDGYPDFTGEFYSDGYLKSGDNNFEDVHVYELHSNQVVDFNLPDAFNWRSTDTVLPKTAVDSQLAIIGEDMYLFGGIITDRILKASINSPAEWVDTGATLPKPVYGSQLAIIDGYIYLFGGCNGGNTQDASKYIFRATTSNPLAWVDTGATIPAKIYGSQLAIADGYIYLCGGHHSNGPTDLVFRAHVSDPLSWSDDGYRLYESLYGSQLAIYGGYAYLIGGLIGLPGFEVLTNKIYKAPLSNLGSWTVSGTLPVSTALGQIAFVGSDLFYFGGWGTEKYILRAKLADPIFTFEDTFKQLPIAAIQSQLAIIYDRVFLFGGNGSTVIQVCDNKIKFKLTNPRVADYANAARVVPQGVSNILDMFKAIGFTPWRTDYGSL